jgi:hypothetical protein
MSGTGSPPDMAGWNLTLRFGLEVAALVGLGFAAWRLSPDTLRWVVVIVVPVAAAIVWGVFNVLDDPSRSGAAPIEVPGWTRLAIELSILGGGAVALAVAWRPDAAIAFAILTALHYATSWSRIEWLLQH